MERTERNFRTLTDGAWREKRMVCVGLDPDWDKIPANLKTNRGLERSPDDVIFDFNARIIDATCDLAGHYKPQAAYYERFKTPGWNALDRTVAYIKQQAPHTGIILDAKRGDIGRTNQQYATGLFDELGVDAVTLHTYLGAVESLRPFFDYKNKGCIVLCRTSNKDGGEFQDLKVAMYREELASLFEGPARPRVGNFGDFQQFIMDNEDPLWGIPLYLVVALRTAYHWNTNNNCLLVVGATYSDEAKVIRGLVGDEIDFLVPGAGTQGGSVEAAVKACRNSRGNGFIMNSSSGIIHASSEDDFAEKARSATQTLNDQIVEHCAS